MSVSVGGIAAVGFGAAVGAWARWGLSLVLNPVFPTVPLGTLAANLVGGFLMGVCMALISHYEAMSPELRLLLTTGFLGGLTTFSTYSAEVVTLLEHGEYGWAGATASAHLLGSLALTAAGIAFVKLVLR